MKDYVEFKPLGYKWVVKGEFASTLKEHVVPSVLSGDDVPRLRVIKRKFLRSLR